MKRYFLISATLIMTSFLFISCGFLTAKKDETQKNSNSSSNSGSNVKKDQEVVKNSLGMEFVKVPAGSFTMGAPESEPDRSDGEMQHQVTLTKDFFLSKYETTQAQWKELMGNNPSDSTAKDCGDNCPVDYVSWDDVQEFIKKLNAKGEGTYRLPTDAEWEYACRAGTTDTYGGNLDDIGWYGKNSDRKIHPVGQKKANDFGLYDMHGNVTEWTANWSGGTPSSDSVTDPKGEPTGYNRLIRNGNAFSSTEYVRSAYKSAGDPKGHFNYAGFRLVKE